MGRWDGIFFVDAFGGTEAVDELQETRSAGDEQFNPNSAEVISTGRQELTPQTPAWDVDTSISQEVVDLERAIAAAK